MIVYPDAASVIRTRDTGAANGYGRRILQLCDNGNLSDVIPIIPYG